MARQKLAEGFVKVNVKKYGRMGSGVKVATFEIVPEDQEAATVEKMKQRISKGGWLAGGWVEVTRPKVTIKGESQLGQLVILLKEKTEAQRLEYITRTGEWAASEFERTQEWLPTAKALRDEVLAEYRAQGRVRGEYRHSRLGRPYYSKEWYAHEKQINAAELMAHTGKAKFIQNCQQYAEAHYHASIDKLALRIEEKGLDLAKLEVTQAEVKQNLETRLTDGTQVVRAFTILAWGPIVRPHYRYLIK